MRIINTQQNTRHENLNCVDKNFFFLKVTRSTRNRKIQNSKNLLFSIQNQCNLTRD